MYSQSEKYFKMSPKFSPSQSSIIRMKRLSEDGAYQEIRSSSRNMTSKKYVPKALSQQGPRKHSKKGGTLASKGATMQAEKGNFAYTYEIN